ncbi:MAG: hypothetical protein K8T20_14660 [Planctomycetes bacterium]|nr:hypothetical protein [Planctomycetota bacterium]
MTRLRWKASVAACGLLAVLALGGILFLGWSRGSSGDDPVAMLPAGMEAVVRVRSVPAAAEGLGRLSGMDLDALRQSAWYGPFGGAALGVRGNDAIAVIESPRLGRFGPLEDAAAAALHVTRRPDGSLELSGRTVWIASRGSWLWVATSEALLKEGVARAGQFAAILPGTPAITIEDHGLMARLEGEREAGKLGDAARMIQSRLRGILVPGGVVAGTFEGDSLVLRGGGLWVLGAREVAKRVQSAQPPMVSRLAARTIPGVALRHSERFFATYVWDELLHDPDNARFVAAFRREIADYEKFLGGRKFESDLLPKLGPEREWAVARVDWAAYGVTPKSPVPAVLFACEVRGIEAETLKSIDKFLTEAEKEGKRFDLPAPKGRAGPVLDPFKHEKAVVDGVEVWKIVFREGVSEFGAEFSPGYAVIDGTLWITTFWPLLPKITSAPPTGLAVHAWGDLDGPAALAVARDLAGEMAEMTATWSVLDSVHAAAREDFVKSYGSTSAPTDAYLRAFTALEDDLTRERPDLAGAAFDRELEERLKAWEAGETRAFAARRVEPLKATAAFRADVAARRADLERHLDIFAGLGRASWSLRREFDGHAEVDAWEARFAPRR